MRKPIKLTLSGPWFNDPTDATGTIKRFRVERISNSIDHVPLQFLTEKETRELCASTAYDVTIVPLPKD
jgi:hypothetical protein